MVYFEKSQPAPVSLAVEKMKLSGIYRTEDVIQKLEEDFKGKCYICELKYPTSINVEHFISHQGDLDLKFDWNNLFFACGHCNNVKLAGFDALLNCTCKDDNVDTAIYYQLNPFPKEKAFFEVKIHSEKAEKTKELLDKTFNGEHTALKVLESSNLRNLLLQEIKEFLSLCEIYLEDTTNTFLAHKIQLELGNSSAFTAFKRWIVRDNKSLSKEFEAYI